jgi:hypothetical protein
MSKLYELELKKRILHKQLAKLEKEIEKLKEEITGE